MQNRVAFVVREGGHLGMIIALSDEMIAEGWGARDEDERIAEFCRRFRIALGLVQEIDGREIVTTASGQIVMFTPQE